jgi:hypothetical protein
MVNLWVISCREQEERVSSGNQFDASASLAGYIYQCRLALLLGLRELKKRPNCSISIEKYDDVAFNEGGDIHNIVQAKHHIEPKDLSDLSVDLWKTIRIWVDQFKTGTVTNSNTKRFLITTASAPPESATSKLRAERNDRDLALALSKLKAAARLSANKASKAGREAFLDLKDEEALVVLSTITVMDAYPGLHDVFDEIEGELRVVSPNHSRKVAEALEGWWLGVVAKRLMGEDSAEVPVQHIAIKAQEIGILYGPQGLPISNPDDLGIKTYHLDDEAELYVKQMRLIRLPDRTVQRGIRDFYRSNAQRSRWARENLLLDGDVTRYEAKLRDQWERKFDAECCDSAESDASAKEKLGREVYFWANQQQIGFRNVVEMWITAGSFHGLADRMVVGWHPDFDEHLGSEDDNGNA